MMRTNTKKWKGTSAGQTEVCQKGVARCNQHLESQYFQANILYGSATYLRGPASIVAVSSYFSTAAPANAALPSFHKTHALI